MHFETKTVIFAAIFTEAPSWPETKPNFHILRVIFKRSGAVFRRGIEDFRDFWLFK